MADVLAWPFRIENAPTVAAAVSFVATLAAVILAIAETTRPKYLELPRFMPPIRSTSSATEGDEHALPFPGAVGPDGKHQTRYLTV